MSRSRRHTPICSWTVTDHNEHWFKRQAHRKLRQRVRDCLKRGMFDNLPELREVSDWWYWPKDGKQVFDPSRWPEGMRK